MGFSSYDCLACGHPMISSWASNRINDWMGNVVCIATDGKYFAGRFDGYNRVSQMILPFDSVACYHAGCYEKAGRPAFKEISKWSKDQGYFFDDPEHDMEDPYPKVSENFSIFCAKLGIEVAKNEKKRKQQNPHEYILSTPNITTRGKERQVYRGDFLATYMKTWGTKANKIIKYED